MGGELQQQWRLVCCWVAAAASADGHAAGEAARSGWRALLNVFGVLEAG